MKKDKYAILIMERGVGVWEIYKTVSTKVKAIDLSKKLVYNTAGIKVKITPITKKLDWVHNIKW